LEKTNNLKDFGSMSKLKDLKWIVKSGQGHLSMREIDLSLIKIIDYFIV
jgi:hypothetical protein